LATVACPLDILTARVDTANTPELTYIVGTNFPVSGYAFPQSSAKAIYLNIGAELYGNSGNWTLDLHWYSRSGSTTGNVTWTLAMAAITPTTDTGSVEGKAFATAQTVTTAVNTGAKGDTLSSATISNLDSVNAGDDVFIKVTRTDTSMVGDAILLRASLSYSDGNSGTAGSGDFVGPASATSTALVRFNGTTGKLGQNSPVLCDASGNLTGVGTINSLPVDFTAVSPTTATFQPAITIGDVTGTSVTLPVAGTFMFLAKIPLSQTGTTATAGFTVNVTGGTVTNVQQTQVFAVNGTSWNQSTNTSNNTTIASVARTTATTVWTCEVSGSFTTTAAGTVVLRAIASVATTYTCQIGTFLFVQKQ
jgi:hypothetical protein